MSIKKNIIKHKSFAVIVLGAISIFLTNLFLKSILSPSNYGEYSLIITFIQLLFSFGLIGFEQVFLRKSKVLKKDIIATSKTLLILLFSTWIVFGIISAIVFNTYYSELNLSNLTLIFIALSITFSMFLYNTLRLNSSFFSSQLMLNLWKIILGILSIVFLFNNAFNLQNFFNLLSYLFLGTLILQILFLIRKITFKLQIDINPKELLLYAFHFFLSLLTISLISFGDRLFIKTNFGAEQLGDYFFLATIFLFPFSLLQGYIGFKELVAFKNKKSLKGLNKKIIKINILGIIMIFLIVISVIIINQVKIISYIDLRTNFVLILFFLLTGIIKLNYSLFSALLGARANIKTIKRANIQSILFISVVLFIAHKYIRSVEIVALLIFLFWFSRTLIFRINLFKQFKKV